MGKAFLLALLTLLVATLPSFAEDSTTDIPADQNATIEVIEETTPLFDDTPQVSATTLSREEIMRTPGSFEDVSRVVATLPGVVAEGAFTSQLYIRGGDSSETVSYLDSIFLGGMSHWGGIFTVFNNELIEEVDFYAGGFPAKYVNTLSGVIDVEYRDGNREGFRGVADLSLISSKLALEGPLGDTGGSYLIGLRRTYIDAFLRTTGLADEGTLIPYFGDYYGKISLPLAPQHELEFTALATEDGAELEEFEDESVEGRAEPGSVDAYETQLLGGVRWTWTPNTSWVVSNEAYFDYQKLTGDITGSNPYSADLIDRSVYLYGDARHVASDRHSFEFGYLLGFLNFQLEGLADDIASEIGGANEQFTPDPESKITFEPEFRGTFGGVYFQDTIRLTESGIQLTPGLRADYWYYNEEATLSPRLAMSFPVPLDWTLKLSGGYYYQYPTNVLKVDEEYGNPDLLSEKAAHYVVGVEGPVGSQMKLRVESWYKDYDELIVNYDSDAAVTAALLNDEEIFRNDGDGYAYGFDVFWQKRFSNKWDGYLSYGWSKVFRKNPLHTENPIWYAPRQDQRHTLNVVANYAISEKWHLGAKFTLQSGRPYTPIVGWEVVPHPTIGLPIWSPVYGTVNSDRFPLFHQLDLRIERRWGRGNIAWAAYLDLMNAYNQQNVYNYDWLDGNIDAGIPPRRQEVYNLPLVPFMGVRARW